MNKFAGKWIVIDPKKEKIIAFGETLNDISPFVTRKVGSKDKFEPVGQAPYSFLVPRKDEGPYIL